MARTTGGRARRGRGGACRGALAMLVALVAVGLAGCNTWSSVDPTFRAATLTTEGADTYTLTYNPATRGVQVAAPATNGGGNNRGVFWSPRATPAVDGETCARWVFESGSQSVSTNIQEGAALRVRPNADGSVDALTVTRNVWAGVYFVFNVHAWHAKDGNAQYSQLADFNLWAVVADRAGYPARLPWNLCAQVTGTQLRFVVWLAGQPRPAYGTPGHGGTLTLPGRYVYPGYSGWYAGHLRAGQSVDFDSLTPSP